MLTHAIDDALAALLALPRTGSGVGLVRFRELISPLFERPWLPAQETIKITGSNGKGSVTAMTAALLSALGVSAGRYVSPHLFRFNERICIDGEAIDDGELAAALAWFEQRRAAFAGLHPGEQIGAFEAFTALAMHAFEARSPEVLVVEAGIGGRFDPTRVLPGGLAALVSVDLEHTDLLGATKELIAYEKADICPDGGHLVLGALDDALFERVSGYAALRRITVERPLARRRVENLTLFPTHMQFDLHLDGLSLPDLRMGLLGRHQIDNAVLALTLVQRWLVRTGRDALLRELPDAARRALGALRWPGRFERVAEDPEVFVDVGHTPEAARRAASTARELAGQRPIVILAGVSAQKDVEGVGLALAAVAHEVVATRALFRGAAPSRVAAAFRAARSELGVHEVDELREAVALARERAAQVGGVVLVAGSLYLAVETTEVCAQRDPAALRFFGG